MSLKTLEIEYGDVDSAIQTIREAHRGIDEIMKAVTDVVTTLIMDALGFMVNVLRDAVEFLKNAFQHLFEKLVALGDTVRRVVQEHHDADKAGAEALKSVLR